MSEDPKPYGRRWIDDPGLDQASLAAMTDADAREYLRLLLDVLSPELPSLTWLKRAAAAKRSRPQGVPKVLIELLRSRPPMEP
jgi:hypothetical protein